MKIGWKFESFMEYFLNNYYSDEYFLSATKIKFWTRWLGNRKHSDGIITNLCSYVGHYSKI